MEKTILVPDTHGRNWFDYELGTNPVFLADYVDSFTIPGSEQFKQLQNIIAYKFKHPKTTLLLGNHDVQYMYFPKYRCSGFQEKEALKFREYFFQHKHLFTYMVKIDDYYISHAGVSKSWFNFVSDKYGIDLEYLPEFINSEPKELFWIGPKHNGLDLFDGPLWARNLWEDDLEIKQIVGHTFSESGSIVMSKNITVIDNGRIFELIT